MTRIKLPARCGAGAPTARLRRAVAATTVLCACLVGHAARAAGNEPPKTAHACVNIEGHTAPVRAIGFTPDGSLLCTAGLDKVVHVWRLPPTGGRAELGRTKGIVRERWGKVRTLRWPMGRGLRGAIYAMAVHPVTGQLAIGGYGNLQLTGEVVWLDPFLGQWKAAEYEHFFGSIGALSYSADGRWLASIDTNGRAMLRATGADGPSAESVEIAAPDARHPTLKYPRIAIVGGRVVLPVFDRSLGPGRSIWKLRQYHVARRAMGAPLAADHHGEVTALAASADGRWFASADEAGHLFLWRPGETRPRKQLDAGAPIVALAFSPDGRTLAAGTRLVPGAAGTELQLWDTAAGTLLRKRTLADDVNACAFSPDGCRLAYSGGEGSEVYVESVDPSHRVLTIPGGTRVTEVAFTQESDDYDVVFKSLPVSFRGARRRTFSTAALETRDEAPPTPESTPFMGSWSYVAKPYEDEYRLWLYRDQKPQGSIRLDKARHGHLTCQCWIPGPDGQPMAVAVGTAVQNGLFVYGLPRGGDCPLLQYCRGHHGRVASVAASRDGRYLVSASADGTIRFWPLRGALAGSALLRRWGAVLEPSATGRGLTVASIDDLGPLHQKGVRAGDAIDKIEWNPGTGNRAADHSAEMLRQLAELPWDLQVTFTVRRADDTRRFNLRGGWHPMLTVYATDSQWIAWTPAGYYACSPGGERLMGWLVNPDRLNRPPSFYTAEQLNRALYRPEVIRKLLREGSLAGAMAATDEVQDEPRVEAPTQVEPPKVRITSPTPGRKGIEIREPRITVTAMAEAAGGRPITAMRLQLDGRPYRKKGYARGIARERLKKTESWTLELTPGEHVLQVIAETEASKGQSERVVVRCLGPEVKPSLYVLAIGISEYPGGMALEYGHSDAEQVVRILQERRAEEFGETHVREITDGDAVKSAIVDGFQWLRDHMKQPDVGVVFYSGHGVQDDRGGFYLLPVDGSLDDLPGTCVSDALIKQYCENTVGRLVFMVDACHSGGIDLTASGRAPVDDLARDFSRSEYSVIMMASSTGREVSFEHERWGGGAFTKALSEGLTGSANFAQPFADDVIITSELDLYVYARVSQLTERRQTPVSSKPAIPPFALTKILGAAGE